MDAEPFKAGCWVAAILLSFLIRSLVEGETNAVKGGDEVQLPMKGVVLAPQCCLAAVQACSATMGPGSSGVVQDPSVKVHLLFIAAPPNSYHCPVGSYLEVSCPARWPCLSPPSPAFLWLGYKKYTGINPKAPSRPETAY